MRVNTNRWNRVRYTLYTPVYDLFVRRLARGRRRAIELLNVQPGERVLIIGCGTGLDLELLPREARIDAIDLTPSMVERTRARATILGIDAAVRVMDAATLDYADGTFDAVILHLILAVVPDPFSTAREAGRVLRDGGRVSIFDKFLPDHARPSVVRRLANAIARVVATELNRRLAPLLADTGLRVVRDESSIFGGMFRVVVCTRIPRHRS